MNLQELKALDWRDPVVAFSLFGSRARGDEEEESDYDILVWSKGRRPHSMRVGLHALAIYPCDYLMQKANEGDLFVSHLVHEAKDIWDPRSLLSTLRRRFAPRGSYDRDIENATQIGVFLLKFHHRLPASLINRRIAWVARTILIAKAMEQGEPVFATQRLAHLLDAPEISPLVALKDEIEFRPDGLVGLNSFLQRWGGRYRTSATTIDDFRALFHATGNAFGTQTIRSIRREADVCDYR